MKVSDVMNCHVTSVAPELPLEKLADLLLKRHISAVPVTDSDGRLVGIVSEGDLVRRPELGTDRRESWWLRAFASRDLLAERYLKTHGLKVADVMTRKVVTIEEDAPLAAAADLIERHHVKRLPVMRGSTLVGIISRANLVQALASAGTLPPGEHGDNETRAKLVEALGKAEWVPHASIHATVRRHVAHLWGAVETEAQRNALQVLASRIPGVRDVKNHVAVLPPVSAMWP